MTNLSNVFKYISYFRHAGHQVGRKVGDMLEILTYASIARDEELLSRLHVESKLFGFSDAGHKVEFTLLNEKKYNNEGTPSPVNGGSITNTNSVIGFIECKKVGVEQTVNGTFKRAFIRHDNKSFKVPFGSTFDINFSPRESKIKHKFKVSFCEDAINVLKDDNTFVLSEVATLGHRIIFALSEDNKASVIGNNRSLRDFSPILKNCRILEIIDISDDGYIAILNDCLAGPQTPEKAKQSSFVALDVRKKRFKIFDKREIDAFMRFEEKFGTRFYDKITKDNFEKDNDVRDLCIQIVNEKNGKIFRDIDDDKIYKISVKNNRLEYK